MSISKAEFRGALSRLAAGVSIITTEYNGERRGITATAVCSVSAEPPTVLICANSATGTSKMISAAGFFGVNFLEASQRPVSDMFAGADGIQGERRFDVGDWVPGDCYGMPLLPAALAQLECRVVRMIEVGTHDVYFGLVESAKSCSGRPLIYHGGGYLSYSFADKDVQGLQVVKASAV